jgi:prepilin-type N-terminal cleavage/methylation domain-containing protein
MFPRSPRPRSHRRGVTLVEMLVSVALLVLLMTVIVQVFQAATGAVSAARTYQELDSTLRQLDATLRTDLGGVTARTTPPLNPDLNLGYLEYGENSFADIQGDDCDDYIRFTTKAPEGQLFYGRMYIAPAPSSGLTLANMTTAQLLTYASSQPVTVTSQYAEIIYFLRNGNLYRRVLLIAPEKQDTITTAYSGVTGSTGLFNTGTFGIKLPVSWQGVNDISARPAASGLYAAGSACPIVLNSLGDLTNRENRAFNMRFASDFMTDLPPAAGGGTTYPSVPDGTPDDANWDTVPDFYPSLYADLFTGNSKPFGGVPLVNEGLWWGALTGRPSALLKQDLMAFPYIYPGMYSSNGSDPYSVKNNLGFIHTPDPSLNQSLLADLEKLNHNPLDIGLGDSLPAPGTGSYGGTGLQTWWGFPTWRETMDSNWNDPYVSIGNNYVQPTGLSALSPILLPPMNAAYRLSPQPYNDSTGQTGSTGFADYPVPPFSAANVLWKQAWEDDLIATGVRSFDVKAYDNAFPGFVDLGWGDDIRITGGTSYLAPTTAAPTPLTTTWNGTIWSTYGQTFAHEGRMPPLTTDQVIDPQYFNLTGNSHNVGDDYGGLIRLRRVWDSWSTDYSYAPATGVDSNNVTPSPTFGFPIGPPLNGLPVYPSYPAPYPAPLRGIQIQIRIVDPRNERIKVLTIRQDFSDKL